MAKGLSFCVVRGRGTRDARGSVDAADAGGAGGSTVMIRRRNGAGGPGTRIGGTASGNRGTGSRGVV